VAAISRRLASEQSAVGYVHEPDEKWAIASAAKDYDVSDRLVDRLIETPEEG
jgi:hypothetical protein